MKLCLANDRFPPDLGGGGMTYAFNLARELSKKHEVTVYAMDFGLKEKQNGFEVKRIATPHSPWTSKGFLEFLRALPKELGSEEFDAVHCCNHSIASFLKKNSFTVTSHGTSFGELKASFKEGTVSPKNFLQATRSYVLELLSCSKARKVIATSNAALLETKKAYFLGRKMEMVPYGVDLEYFKPAGKEKGFALFAGRLSPRKGLFTLLNAMQETDLNLKIAGDGEMKKQALALAEANGLGKSIEFLGWQERKQMKKLLQECMFLLVPSYYESMPLVVLEAMACGKPVIGSSVMGLPEVISDGKNGLLAEAGNQEELNKKINFLLKEKHARKKMGKNARKTAEAFSWKKCAGSHARLFREGAK